MCIRDRHCTVGHLWNVGKMKQIQWPKPAKGHNSHDDDNCNFLSMLKFTGSPYKDWESQFWAKPCCYNLTSCSSRCHLHLSIVSKHIKFLMSFKHFLWRLPLLFLSLSFLSLMFFIKMLWIIKWPQILVFTFLSL